MKKRKKEDENEEIFLNILENYKLMIYKFCRMFSNNSKENFKDLYQQVCCNLYRYFLEHKERTDSNWVYAVTTNTLYDYGRKRKLTDKIFVKLDINHEIEDERYDQTKVNILYELISRLPPLDKVIICFYLEKFSYEEIAQRTNLSVSNVGTKIQRIKEKLKQLKDELYGNEEF